MSRKKRVLTIVLSLLLVTSVFGYPTLVDNKDNDKNKYIEMEPTVKETEAIAPAAVAGGILIATGVGAVAGAVISSGNNKNLKGDSKKVKTLLYDRMLSQSSSLKTITSQQMELLNRTHNGALSEAKLAAVRALNDGKTKAVAQSEAKEAIRDFYSQMEKNRIKVWNDQIVPLIRNGDKSVSGKDSYPNAVFGIVEGGTDDIQIVTDSGVEETNSFGPLSYRSDKHVNWSATTSTGITLNDSTINLSANNTETHTLVNGTDVEIRGIKNNAKWTFKEPSFAPKGDNVCFVCDNIAGSRAPALILLFNPKDNHKQAATKPIESDEVFLNISDYRQDFLDIRNENAEAQIKLFNFTDDLYANFEPGEVDASDVLGPSELLDRAVGEDGNISDRAWNDVQRQILGLNRSSEAVTIRLENDNETLTGNMFSDAVPPTTDNNGSHVWKVNETYDPGNFSGDVLMQTSDDLVNVEQPFTILEAVDQQTNEEVDEFGPSDDPEELPEAGGDEIDEAIDEQEDLEDRLKEIEENFGGGILPGIDPILIIILIGGVAAVLLLTSDD